MYVHRFTVFGSSPFPIDMLRYDGCYPATQRDVGKIENSDYATNHRITLEVRSALKSFHPTEKRWQSFGWSVVEQHEPSVKG